MIMKPTRIVCQKFMGLSLLQLNHVQLALEHLKDDSPTILQNLCNYFENFWMTDIPLRLRNISDPQMRTNNNCEGIYTNLPCLQ